jgi:hypothetical protein
MKNETTYKIIDNLELLSDYGIYEEAEFGFVENYILFLTHVVVPEYLLN